MSRKNQQNKKVPQKYQDSGNDYQFQEQKGQGKGKFGQTSDTLEPNDADRTEYLSLLANDYPVGNIDSQVFSNINKQDNSMLILLGQKILADFKYLLIMPFKNFWATIKHNYYLQDALDLFLRYSPREHFMNEEVVNGVNREYWRVIQEIYRCILWVYVRMVSFEREDQEGLLCKQWGCSKILYENWLIDIMKLTDIAIIYGANNQQIVKRIIDNTFTFNKTYTEDFKAVLNQCFDKILDKIYSSLTSLSNQSLNESDLFTEDIKQKMDILTLTLDTVETLLTWVKYFPQKQAVTVLQSVKAIAIIEQIYYETLMIRGFVRGQDKYQSIWRIDKLPQDLTPLLNKILDKILDFFCEYFNHLVNLALQISEKSEKLLISQLNEQIQYLIHNFGLVRRKGTKPKKNQSENEIKEWYLVEGLSDKGFSVPEFFANLVPWELLNQVDKNEQKELQDILNNVIEERSVLKQIAEGMQIEQINPIQDIDDYDPEGSVLPQLEVEYKEQVEEQNVEQEEDKDFVQQNEEKLTKLVSKRNQQVTIELPIQKRQELADMMAKLYDDEPDDTYDYDAVKRSDNDKYDSDDRSYKHQKQEYSMIDPDLKQSKNIMQRSKFEQNSRDNQNQGSNQYQEKSKYQDHYQAPQQDQYIRRNDDQNRYQENSKQQYQQKDSSRQYEDKNKDQQIRRNDDKSYQQQNQKDLKNKYDNQSQSDYKGQQNNRDNQGYKNQNQRNNKNDNYDDYDRNDDSRDQGSKKVLQKQDVKVDRDGGYVNNVYKVKDNQLNSNKDDQLEPQQQQTNKEHDQGTQIKAKPQAPLKGYKTKQQKNHHDEGKGYRNRDNYAK